ncbi:MAG TPA: hypothetical protein VFN37_11030 [Candidatus Baltobacteraceae bacterium]|nr:hypothetical protein [Candidatus Baltobacteraceae bacterium]
MFLFQSASHPQMKVPLGPFTMLLGGTAKGDLAAQAQAWSAIGMFLQQALSATVR